MLTRECVGIRSHSIFDGYNLGGGKSKFFFLLLFGDDVQFD